MKKALPIVLTILTSTSALADDTWYLGALYSAQDVSIDDRDFNSAGIILGYQYHKILSLETRYSAGTSGYSSHYGPTTGDYKEDINKQASLLIKASYPIFESFNVYGLAGYSNTEFEIKFSADVDAPITDIMSINQTESVSGFNYGMGFNYQVNEGFSVFLDYQVLPEIEYFSKSLKSTSIGVNYSF